MPTLGKLWAGRIFGTNTGNFFLEIQPTPEGAFTGTLRLLDTLLGLHVYQLTGTFDGTNLTFIGNPSPTESQEGVVLGVVKANASLSPQGQLVGTWQSELGTGGTFSAFPHDPPASAPDKAMAPTLPEQLYTSTIAVGAVRMYAEDLSGLVELVRKDFLVGRPIITYTLRGIEVTQFLEDFENAATELEELRQFKLVIQEPEAYNINKVVVVELSPFGANTVRVQGINETWVIGKSEATARVLRKYENLTLEAVKRLGITLNQLILLAMLVAIPAIQSTWQRALFVIGVVLISLSLGWLHTRFLPNVTIYLSKAEPNAFARLWPSILSLVLGIIGSLIASWLYTWLTS